MRTAKNSRRERQSIWCCGHNYQRWRLRSRDWPGTHHTHCCACRRPLNWPAQRILHRPNPRLASRLAKRRLAERYLALGLTTNGQRRQRHVNFIWPSERAEANRQRNLRSYHQRAEEFMRQGLTSRGTPRKVAPKGSRQIKPNAKEIAYRSLRAGMGIVHEDVELLSFNQRNQES